MITLRVTRHDRNEQLLAECQSAVIPARGEVLQLDTVESDGSMSRPSTLWRIVAVTVHVPSLNSSAPDDGTALCVRTVEVSVQIGRASCRERVEVWVVAGAVKEKSRVEG